ncbi:MAG: acyl carrier protein [Clostridia bacterium]|nr:acyl carrier protein [Clostridia bacterium]MDD4685981.1 acyl carrier protein [Clostridia bacterium]
MTIDKIKKIIASQLNISEETIKDDSRIVEDLGADSLDIVEMLMTFEEEFGVNIPDEDTSNMKTVAEISDMISKKTK